MNLSHHRWSLACIVAGAMTSGATIGSLVSEYIGPGAASGLQVSLCAATIVTFAVSEWRSAR